jgi:tRNA-2-methylthio-N6-dimethylallyladenosine synthase
MKYFIETYGCQMNVHDSERMAGLLEASGYERADADHDADLVVINTCSVREKAEDKLYTRLGDLKGLHRATGHAPMVVVAGCVAQQEGNKLLERSDLIDVVVGTQRVKMLPMLVEQARAAEAQDRESSALPLIDISTPYEEPSFALGLTRRTDPVKAYVTIIEGCNDYCAYCVVPYTRGHERMRAKSEILAEVRDAVATGRQEIHLLGQIVNHYAAPDDPQCDFPALLEAVNAVPGVRRIRFASPHPRHASPRLIAAVRDLPAVCKHMHLPVQSGSSRVLQLMRRRHTREQYLELVHAIRDAIPDIQLSTDMIVGFPGETGADYEDTLSLTEAVRFHSMFSFKYSERPKTLASKRMPDDVTEDEKTRRIVGLQQLQRRIQIELHEAAVGQTVDVLVDSVSRRRAWELSGRTSGNTVVNFAGDPNLVGRLVPITIRRAGAYSLWGVIHEGSPVVPSVRGCDAYRDVDQRADGRSHHQHADHHPARSGRAEGAADLGGHLRSQRHRAAD